MFNFFNKKRSIKIKDRNIFLKSKAVLCIILLFIPFFNFNIKSVEAVASWYSTSWGYRTKITIDHTKVQNTDQSYFPVLINRTDTNWKVVASGGHVGQADGGDIVFTSSDGTTKLDHEIEIYTSSTGALIAWVEVPTVTTATDTEIYMYYGNASVADQWNINGTWNGGGSNAYKAVWHLPNGTTLTTNDSTSNANNGTKNGSVAATTGQVDGAGSFPGNSGDYIVVPDSNSLDLTTAWTISLWVKPANLTQTNKYILGKQTTNASDNTYALIWEYSNNNVQFYSSTTNGTFGYTGTNSNLTISDTNWHYVTYTYDGTHFNGQLDGTPITQVNATANLSATTGPLYIGAFTTSGNNINATLDEIRISNTARSADWRKTEYNNQSSPSTFYSVASEESVTAPTAPTGLTLTRGNGQVGLSWTVPSSDGGFPITDYVIDYKLTSEPTTWSTFADGVSTGTSGTITGLTNGSSYDFRVSAVNAVGQGSASSTSSLLLAILPDAPTIGAATGGNAQASVAFTTLSNPTSTFWYNSSWGYRKKITIDHTKVQSTDQLYFPVLISRTDISLKDVSNGGHVGQADGGDIVFTHSDGTTKLSHEIEVYTPSTGALIAWVKVPSVSTSTDTDLYIYYGNAGAADQWNVNDTWSDSGNNNYKGVWHLPNGTTLTSTDSTSTAANGTINSASATTGQVYGAASFNGTTSYITMGTNSTLRPSSSFTLSAWVKVSSTASTYAFLSNYDEASSKASGVAMQLQSHKLRIFSAKNTGIVNGTDYKDTVGSVTIDDNAWHYIVGLYDSSSQLLKVYVDGTVDGSVSWANNPVYSTNNIFNIGALNYTSPSQLQFTNGIIDESRIANTARSADWIKTEYNNQSSPSTFYSVASEETPSGTPSNGGSAITGYTATSSPGGITGTNTTSPIVVTGLTNGTAYTFTVTATNVVGTGSASSASNSVTPATVPGAPTAFSGTAGNTQVALSWSAPASNGGSAITDYVVEYKLTSDVSWSIFSDGTSTSTSATVTGLTNGSSYDFRVSAVNAIGQGSASSTTSVTPITTPGAPTSVTAVRGNAQATVSFTAPVSNGGSTITGYTVTSSPGSITATGSASPIVVAGLTNGTSYTFTVTATNAAGTGSVSSTSNSVTPATVPDAPTSPSAVYGNAQATVTFTPPVSNGGSAITSYTVTSSPGGITASGSASPITVTGLTNGTAYTFTVTATNAVGTSSASSSSNSVTPITVPDAPTSVSATEGNTQATISFTPPASNGGSAITSYTVTSNPGGITATGSASPIIVTGLTNGTGYTFTVTATNAAGTSSASSASGSVTPATVPDSPTSLTPTAGNAQVALSWTAPAVNGGVSIIDYVIEYKLTSELITWSMFADSVSTSTSGTVTGLTNGLSYDFRVSAVNAVGQGSASSIATATPATVPDIPTSVIGTSGNAQISVAFTPPASNGGSAITSYTVTSSPGGITASGSASPITVTGLTNGTAYTFTVTATNAVGTSSASSSSNSVTPITVPDAPTSVSATEGNTQATISFTPPASNGGSAITSYTVTSNPGGITATGSASPIIVTGLTNGTGYTFTVTATNAAGTSASSSVSNSVTLSTEPGTPVNLAATVLGSSIGLSWSAPASNGGSAITDYVVEYQLTTGGSWSVFADSTSTNTTAIVTGLSNDNSYDFRVSAVNSIGQSIPSSFATATPGEPAQVLIQSFPDLTTTTIGTAVRITNEGAVSYEYQYTWCITDSSVNLCGGGDDIFSSSAAKLISSLENWDTILSSNISTPGSYYFHIFVSYGSQSSSAYQSFTAVATYPDAPNSPSAVYGNTQATISFTPPASNGGSAITSYTVTSNPGGITATGSASPIIVTGLTNGTAYTFTVTATNAVGTSSSSSASNSVIPATVPDSPTSLTPTAGNAQVSLSWMAPLNNGGSVIIDYVIEYKLTSDSSWILFSDGTSTSTSATVTGLTNGSSYDFRVSAVNAVGQSSIDSTFGTLPINITAPSTGGGGGGSYGTYIPTQNPTTKINQIPVNYLEMPIIIPVKKPIKINPQNKPPVYNSSVSETTKKPNQVSAIPNEKPTSIFIPISIINDSINQKFNTIWFLVIVCLGFLLLVLIFFIIVRRRKNNKKV